MIRSALALAFLLPACVAPVSKADAPKAVVALGTLASGAVIQAAQGNTPGKDFSGKALSCDAGGQVVVSVSYGITGDTITRTDANVDLQACSAQGYTISGYVRDVEDATTGTEDIDADAVFSGAIVGRCVVDIVTKGGGTTGTACGYDINELDLGDVGGGDTFSPGDTSL